MILKDLVIVDKPLFVEIGAFVIIKRDGKYYEIPVRMRHEYNPKTGRIEWLVDYKELTKRFMTECDRVEKYYVISTKTSKNIFERPVHEEEFVF